MLASYSQNETVNRTLDYNNTYFFYTGTSTDVLTTTDTTWSYVIWKRTDTKIHVYVDMLIDSTGGTANNVTIYLQNKKFTELEFTTVDSVIWDGTNSTTDGEIISFLPSSESFTFNADSTTTVTESNQFNMGMYWRIYILGADNTLLASIRRLNLHFIKP
jgi:hypothetical protein